MVHPHRRGPWVPEEDQLLIQLVRDQGPNNWVRISQHMHHRSAKQCRQPFHQNLKPSLNRGPISADEGLIIERMVNEMGKRWANIARKLGNRSDNAVKNWWNGSMYRKQRGLSSSTTTTPFSRTSYSGRVEAPYPGESVLSSSINQSNFFPSSLSWYGSQASMDSTTDRRRQQYSTASSVEGPSQLSPIFTLPSIICLFDTTFASPAFSEVPMCPRRFLTTTRFHLPFLVPSLLTCASNMATCAVRAPLIWTSLTAFTLLPAAKVPRPSTLFPTSPWNPGFCLISQPGADIMRYRSLVLCLQKKITRSGWKLRFRAWFAFGSLQLAELSFGQEWSMTAFSL